MHTWHKVQARTLNFCIFCKYSLSIYFDARFLQIVISNILHIPEIPQFSPLLTQIQFLTVYNPRYYCWLIFVSAYPLF